MRPVPYIITALLFFTGCTDCSYQYDLWIKNDTSREIIVETKNAKLRNDKSVSYTDLRSGDYKKIWSSENIHVGNCRGIDLNHCTLITEHVRIKLRDGKTSNLMWCDDYKLEWVDIQQGEISVIVTDKDF